MNLKEWTEAVKFLGSKRSKNSISKIIKEECLYATGKIYGTYQIDGNKVWDILIKDDLNCQQAIEEKKIYNAISLESKMEQLKYHSFWDDNKRAFGRKRR